MADEPRWARSQRAVEEALARGPKSVKQIIEETGFTYNTVKAALGRGTILQSTNGYPTIYTLVKPAIESDAPNVIPIDREPRYIHIVKPLEIQMEELGPRWQAAAQKIGQEIAEIDLEALDLKTAIRHLEIEAASILGAIVTLRSVKDGPDWREQIGL
ncbi:helix-turn-helix DNA binding domain protein [Microbacterium phage Shocker]|uniref:Helix-turn-helix DNA binding domain protein n=1 Tax=Microbacterium phage Shocker TaxID=2805839 RepID=A0A890V1Y4_9CAUD|nr:helix-turn-helix DNA binding domain protein [Microbacterium phage Shocker]QRI45111.1 helix-turn-helix DNA binding domain protein [Microbacterium phage Shocker]